MKALDRIPPTVGLNGIFCSSLLEIVATIEIEDVRVVIWDVGGHVRFLLILEVQKSMRSMWSKYYRDCHGVIFLIDSSDPDRFKEVKDELRLCFVVLLFIGDLASNTDLEDLPILICANKQDLAVLAGGSSNK